MPTVLICDDMAEIRSLLRRALRAHPEIEVVGEACDGQEAVDMANSLRPDVVLLDIQMPEKDGLQALQEIRRDSPNSKIIMLTGLLAEVAGHSAEDLGVDDYIEKGSSLMEIADRILALLDGGVRSGTRP
jgi:DNA-binding NarL/FixJ family response regulator